MQKVFETWADLLNEVTALLNKIKQSDEDRWKNWHPNRKGKKNKNSENSSSDVKVDITKEENTGK